MIIKVEVLDEPENEEAKTWLLNYIRKSLDMATNPVNKRPGSVHVTEMKDDGFGRLVDV